jgi:hypothetical protein
MARKTQNAILNADGTRFAITDVNSVTEYLTRFNALRYIQGSNADGALLFIQPDGKITTENTDKPFYQARPRSGYTQYFNNDGFTDPISPDSLTPQGIGKLMAKLFEVAQVTIAAGGAGAAEMLTVLNGVLAFHNDAAAAFVAAKQAAANEAIAAVVPVEAFLDKAFPVETVTEAAVTEVTIVNSLDSTLYSAPPPER